jgi:hypothetical protein
MNYKGQVLWLFIFIIPFVLLLMVLIIDVGNLWYFSDKLNNINQSVIRYGLKNLEEDSLNKELVDLLYKNDQNIDNHNIEINNNKICISITEEVNSYFGKVTGESHYQLKSDYCGYIVDDKIVIEKGIKK